MSGTDYRVPWATPTTRPELRVPRRRVPVRVQLKNDQTHEGCLYANVQRIDGSRSCIADRLNDATERFLPLAVEDRHILLHKEQIVTIDLHADEMEPPQANGIQEIPVRLHLSSEVFLEGTMHFLPPPMHGRLLDHLNQGTEPFVALWRAGGMTLVNRACIAAATEWIELERLVD